MKLDELIAVTAAASNRLIDIENLGDEELDALRFALPSCRRLRRSRRRGGRDPNDLSQIDGQLFATQIELQLSAP